MSHLKIGCNVCIPEADLKAWLEKYINQNEQLVHNFRLGLRPDSGQYVVEFSLIECLFCFIFAGGEP
jgi:hypothetical protein